MGSSKVWSILALLIGISGLGLSGYMYFFTIPQLTRQQQSGIQNSWYDTYTGPSVDVNTVDTPIPNLSVVATVNSGESLHVLFTTDAFFESGVGIELLYVYITLNGFKVLQPNAMFGAQYGLKIWIELTLPYTNRTIAPGAYFISMVAVAPGSTALKSLYDMTLLAYTFR